jgi:hypothetical protein
MFAIFGTLFATRCRATTNFAFINLISTGIGYKKGFFILKYIDDLASY